MFHSAASTPPLRAALPADPVDGLLDRLANHLAPLFVTAGSDLPAGRLMAVRTIASYQPETQADLIDIGRAVAFSMSALAALSRAASPDIAPGLQLRYLARANALNRSAEQSQRAIERRRLQQRAAAAAQAADGTADFAQPTAEPGLAASDFATDEACATAFNEAAVTAAVAEAMQDYAASQALARSSAVTRGHQAPARLVTNVFSQAPDQLAEMPWTIPVPHDPAQPARALSADRDYELIREIAQHRSATDDRAASR